MYRCVIAFFALASFAVAQTRPHANVPAAPALPAEFTNTPPTLDQAFEKAVEMTPVASTNATSEPEPVRFSADTQVRILGLFEPDTNTTVVPVVERQHDPYLIVEDVPLRTLFRLLTRRAGLNYLETKDDELLQEQITLEMTEPKPAELLDWLLKHRNLELYDGGTGVYTIRQYTNQLAFYRFKLTDNFIDRFKGSASGAGGGSGSIGGYGGGNSVSANNNTIQVENGGKYPEITQLLNEAVKEPGAENKVWYYDEKQCVLLHGTRTASERLAKYLEVANLKNPNVKIDVRIFATGANPMSKMGVDWSAMLSPGLTFGLVPPGTQLTSGIGTNGSLTGIKNLASLAGAFGHPLSSVVLKNDITATVNFFVNDSKAESVAQPSAITANAREVAFAATEQIPYVAGSSVAGTGAGSYGVGYDNTAFVNVGTTINILPRIQDGNRLKLGTAISVSQLDELITISSGTQGSPPRQVPKTSGRAFSGEFTVNSGDTVVIAGLKTSTMSKSRSKVPWLGDIPGLGKLFRNESNQKNSAYLTIFITATILDENNQPGIPEGKLVRADFQPSDESTLSAEPNSAFWLRKTEYSDKALVNARKETLERKIAEANQLMASRLSQQEHVEDIQVKLERKETEIKELETRNRGVHVLPAEEGAIEGLKDETLTRLVRARSERDQLAGELSISQDSLGQLQVSEAQATEAVQQAEEEYNRALKAAFTADKAGPTNELPQLIQENERLFQKLK